VSSDLEEIRGIKGHDTRLIGLGDVCEDDIDHAHEHAVLQGHTRVFDDWHNIRALLGHVDEAGAVRELDRVHDARGANNV
jgi:hypothetical protein